MTVCMPSMHVLAAMIVHQCLHQLVALNAALILWPSIGATSLVVDASSQAVEPAAGVLWISI